MQELNSRYYEPLAAVKPSADDLLKDTVRKLLFMTDPALVDAKLKPFWEVRSQSQSASCLTSRSHSHGISTLTRLFWSLGLTTMRIASPFLHARGKYRHGLFLPLLQAALVTADAQTMQAVPNMLEIVPKGVNKVRSPQRPLSL